MKNKILLLLLSFTFILFSITSCLESDAENVAEDIGEKIEETTNDLKEKLK